MNANNKPLILNVDDNDGARYAKTRVLQLAGFQVAEASSGEQALAKAEEMPPDLVLLDTKLPDLNGFEVCRRIKANPATPGILVLQTSASYLQSADKIRALEGGADNFLVEPIESEELIANVRALLRLREAEQQARESEIRFREMAENVDDVFWMLCPDDGRLLYVSPAYEIVWQRTASGLLEDPMDWLSAVHPQDRERVSQAFSRLKSYDPYDEEYRLQFQSRPDRWVRDRGYPVHNDAGKLYRVARITQDITKQKMAEQQLQIADRRKDEFLATLAHELRNPLGPILHSVQMLELNATPQRVEKSRAMIERQTRHLIHLVDDLLDISRITQGKVSLRHDIIELKTFINAALEASQSFLESRQHQLSISLPEREIWLSGDVTRLAQVVANLLNNAGKYTMTGGHIALQAEADDTTLRISVTDNGIGIAADHIGSLFDLFVQADHAPDRAQDGLGIGLSLVQNLVHLHGGTVSVFSEGEGRGSRFEIALPILQDTPATSAASTSEMTLAALPIESLVKDKPQRILVVDDNRDAAETLAMSLRTDGHQVAVARDGETAIRMAEQLSADIVFLDIGLPGMNGYEIAQTLRGMPATRNTRLVALTGYGQEKDKQRATHAGFDFYLVKPADINQIRALIRKAD
ncbi:MAG TPA: response regulator [Oxalicibacterium sp.]|jgi:PAS domain S-box-containing protein|nr:response regulator [Oxalicibacterium sp.]